MSATHPRSGEQRNPRNAGRKSQGARENQLSPYLPSQVIERIEVWRSTPTEPFNVALNRFLDAWRRGSEGELPLPEPAASRPKGRSRGDPRIKKSVALSAPNRKWVADHAGEGESQAVALAWLLAAAPASLQPPPLLIPAEERQLKQGGPRDKAGRSPKRGGGPLRNATLSERAISRLNERRQPGERFGTALNRIAPLLPAEGSARVTQALPHLSQPEPRQQVNAYFKPETRERVQQLRREGEAWSAALNRLLEALPSRAFTLGRLVATFESEVVLASTAEAALERAANNPALFLTPALSLLSQRGRESQVDAVMGTLPLCAFDVPLEQVDEAELRAGYQAELATRVL